MKILHLADIHLNAPFRSKSLLLKNQFKNSRKEALKRAFYYAISNQFKAIVIAGDFLDHEDVDYVDEKFIVGEFSKVLNAGISVFYATGNHDVSGEQRWTQWLNSFSNFHVFSKDVPEIKVIYDENSQKNIRFIGCGHQDKNESRNLIEQFPEKGDDEIWIGIAHTSVVGNVEAEHKQKYMPTTIETLKKKNYDYFALGHIHKRMYLMHNIAYSGSIEPLDITEIGSHGGIEIEIIHAHIQIKNVDFNVNRMEALRVPLEGILSLFELENTIITSVKNESWKADSLFLRIYLNGKTVLYNELKNKDIIYSLEEHLKEELNVLELELITDEIHLFYDVETLIKDDTVLSQILKMLDKTEPDEEVLSEIPGVSKMDKLIWWQKNKAEIEDELVSRLLRLDYDN